MVAFILFIIINLFCFSKESIPLNLFESSSLFNNGEYYLDTSIYKKYDYIKFTIKFTSINTGTHTLLSRFSNSLDFSKLSGNVGKCESTLIRKLIYLYEYRYKFYF